MQFLKPGFVQIAFGGGGDGGGGGGSDRAPSTRPPPRPSIMTVQRTPEDERVRVATRAMPRFGITEGQSEPEPSYSAFSLRGLTSTDPGNVMRNIQGAERQARAAPMDSGGGDDRPAPAQAAAPTATPAVAPVQPTPAPEMTSVAEQETQIAEAGETAAARARRLGLASTIATSPGGLLAGGQGTTRGRRSLMGGGGLIA